MWVFAMLVLVLHVHSTCFTPTVSCCWQDLGPRGFTWLPGGGASLGGGYLIVFHLSAQSSNEDPVNLSLVILEMNVLHSGRCAYCLAGEITVFIFYPTRFSTLTIHFWRNLILIGFHLPSHRDQLHTLVPWLGVQQYYRALQFPCHSMSCHPGSEIRMGWPASWDEVRNSWVLRPRERPGTSTCFGCPWHWTAPAGAWQVGPKAVDWLSTTISCTRCKEE